MKRFISALVVCTMLLASLSSCQREQTVTTKKANVIEAVFATGHIVSEHEYQVTANTEGYLVQSFVEEGVSVTSGVRLFQLSANVQSENLSNAQANYADAQRSLRTNSPERTQLELQIEQARLQLDLDQKNFERYKKLLSTGAVSQVDFDKSKLQVENAQRNLAIQEKALQDLISNLELNLKNASTQLAIQQEYQEDYFLSSSIAGKVLQVYKQPGELVRKGEVIAVIGGGAKLARLFVAEEDILRVAEHQEVVISLNTNQNETFKAFVSKVYPAFDQVEQSFLVEARFAEEVKKLFNYTQLQANIIVARRSDVTVIPSKFLSDDNSVQLADGQQQAVTSRLRTADWAEVVGLQTGTELLIPSQP